MSNSQIPSLGELMMGNFDPNAADITKNFGVQLEMELNSQKVHFDLDQPKSVMCFVLGIIMNIFTTHIYEKYDIKDANLMINREKIIFTTIHQKQHDEPAECRIFVFGFDMWWNEHFCLDVKEYHLLKMFMEERHNKNLNLLETALNRVNVVQFFKPLFDYKVYNRDKNTVGQFDHVTVTRNRLTSPFKVKTSRVYFFGTETIPDIRLIPEVANALQNYPETIKSIPVEDLIENGRPKVISKFINF